MNLLAKLLSKLEKKAVNPEVQALAELTGAAFLNEADARKAIEEALSTRMSALEARLPRLGLESTSDPRFNCEG
jgi:hypothetical protein